MADKTKASKETAGKRITNNRAASSYASKNMFRKIDADYIQELVFILTDGMDFGGSDFRSTDKVDFTLMTEESYHFPSAQQIPARLTQLTNFLADPTAHPLIKSAVAQAWMVIVQPFPEGNERLGRILSSIILLRAGYTFFSEISLSALISRKSYGYYESIANILREENGFDLTYFIEYFLELLSRAIDERKLRKSKQEEENRQAEIAMAHMPLVPAPHPPRKEETSEKTESLDNIEASDKTETSSNPAGFQKAAAEDGTDAINEEPIVAEDGASVELGSPGDESKLPSIRGNPMEHLIECSKKPGKVGLLSTFVLKQIEEGKQYFWTHDAANELNIPSLQKLSTSIYQLRKYGILQRQKHQDGHTLYKINTENSGDVDADVYPDTAVTNDYPDNSDANRYCDSTVVNDHPDTAEIENRNIEMAREQGYDPSVLDLILKLKNALVSTKDKRLGSMLALCLPSGEITTEDYEKYGHPSRWHVDMHLASQIGIVEKVNSQKYRILQKVKEGPVALSYTQKKVVTEIYKSFGEESFSTEMVVATLDYSSNHVYSFLHNFTLLKILDCYKEGVYKYQFLINPEEYPEYFLKAS